MFRVRAWLAACAAVLALCCVQAPAEAAQALVNAEVPAAKWKGIRIKNLPKGAKVSIQAESTSGGGLDLIFVHRDELKRFPAAVNPEFQGSIERKLSFAVSISRPGDYYIILDNRQGTQTRKARLLIKAERPKGAEGSPAAPPGTRKPSESDI